MKLLFFQPQRTTHNAQPMADHLVQDVVQLMTENLQYQWQLDELADSMLISSRQLERRCKDSLGCGPIQYLRLLRLHAAAALLRTKHEQINQIAQQVGIPDARYFRRSFKELYRVSPGEYRQQQATHVVFSLQMSEISPLSTDESPLR